MFFRITVPGFGTIFVEGDSLEDAKLRARTIMRSNGIDLSDEVIQGIEGLEQVPLVSLSPTDRIFHKDRSTGLPDDSPQPSSLGTPDEGPPPPGPATTGSSQDTRPIGERGIEDRPSVVRESFSRPGVVEPLDIFQFPFGSFQNALASRGFNPTGLLSGSLNPAFNRLQPALDIGTLTGALPQIGEQPGALQSFFETQLGNASTLPLNVFRQLQGGIGSNFIDQIDPSDQVGAEQMRQLFNLARGARTNQLGGFTSRLLPSQTQIMERLDRARAAGATPNLLDFASQQFGL